ncbi:transcriptional regulator GutM [Eubacterium sp.]|uniref:transcriptional regulator GutM n=1 Tax=Eubacterium sp. TaxID=142586 RepID=UPI002FCA01DA
MQNSMMNYLFLVVFGLMALQMFLGLIQVRAYKNAMNALRGTGIVGLGHTKGSLAKKGQVIVLSYKRRSDQVVACKVMRGVTIFARFKDVSDYNGMGLEALRTLAIAQDQKEFKHRRKKHPYDPEEYSKKKGALIQAVEAIDGRIARDDDPEAHRENVHAAAMKQARRRSRTTGAVSE